MCVCVCVCVCVCFLTKATTRKHTYIYNTYVRTK